MLKKSARHIKRARFRDGNDTSGDFALATRLRGALLGTRINKNYYNKSQAVNVTHILENK